MTEKNVILTKLNSSSTIFEVLIMVEGVYIMAEELYNLFLTKN